MTAQVKDTAMLLFQHCTERQQLHCVAFSFMTIHLCEDSRTLRIQTVSPEAHIPAIRHSVDRALPALPALPALSALLDLQFLQLSQLFQLSQFCQFFHSSDALSSPSSSNFEIENWRSWESTYEKSERTNRVGRAGKGGRGREIGDPRKLRELEEPEGEPPSPSSLPPPRNVTKLFILDFNCQPLGRVPICFTSLAPKKHPGQEFWPPDKSRPGQEISEARTR